MKTERRTATPMAGGAGQRRRRWQLWEQPVRRRKVRPFCSPLPVGMQSRLLRARRSQFSKLTSLAPASHAFSSTGWMMAVARATHARIATSVPRGRPSGDRTACVGNVVWRRDAKGSLQGRSQLPGICRTFLDPFVVCVETGSLFLSRLLQSLLRLFLESTL